VTRPQEFIGLHFFSPVDKMPLLEIVVGERTSDETLYRALDFAHQIGKTPIVVNDSRGFFTSRVIGTFMTEGVAMLEQGVPASTIEQASSQAGYPAPVLQLADELSLTLMRKIRDEARRAAEAEGRDWAEHPADRVLDCMLNEFNRPGRHDGAGFYEYEEGKRTRLWRGLEDAFSGRNLEMPFKDLEERMMFIESLETVKCIDEGVIESVADANIGSIFGIGFPAWTGGVVQYMNGYDGGLAGFVARARELAVTYGERFEPPASLVEMAERGEQYSDARSLVGRAAVPAGS
jgi:3-hydroxyacyl-CoA dehydrogenase/enoyl-CoA hydratase/3-hydroxybutyryl-CoA epimerase